MRKILSLAMMLAMSLGFANAQDTMITQSGDILTVYDVEVGGSSVFYKLNASDAASLKMNKNEVLMIKYKDGRVEKMDGSAAPTAPATPAATPQPASSAAFGVNPNLAADNIELVRQYNSNDVIYKGDDTSKEHAALVYTLGLKEGSIIETPELKATFKMKTYLARHGGMSGVLKEQGTFNLNESMAGHDTKKYRIVVILRNKSNRTIYIDQGNSFVMHNDIAQAYYVPSATSTINSSTTGGSVGLGAVAGAFGVGGTLGKLANGVTVGGAGTSATTTTTYSQRIVSIPPMASIELEPMDIGQGYEYEGTGWREFNDILSACLPILTEKNYVKEKKKNYLLDYGKLKRGEKISMPVPEGTSPLSAFFTYGFDENLSSTQTMRMEFYVRQIMGSDSSASYTADLKDIDYSKCPLVFFTGSYHVVKK